MPPSLVQGFAITHLGLEKVTAQEIQELIGAEPTIGETTVFFSATMLDLAKLCYQAQTVGKIILLLGKTSCTKAKDVADISQQIDFSSFLEGKTFCVRCVRVGDHSFDSMDIEQYVGEVLATKYGCKANLGDPDIPVYVYIYGKDAYMGIDFAGFDLSKRQYRVFSPTEQLRATVAYAMLRIAGFKSKTSLLDPFCGYGTILIEAALYACKLSVNYYIKDKFAFRRFPCFTTTEMDKFFAAVDKQVTPETKIVGYDKLLNHVKGAQKNAKIAGIKKQVDISKIDVEWLDTKFGEHELDCIVTAPPIITKFNERAVSKLYKELFYQADFVLKKNGKIVLATPVPDAFGAFAKAYNFVEKERQAVAQGKQTVWIMTFVKG